MKIEFLRDTDNRYHFLRAIEGKHACLSVYESNAYSDAYGKFKWMIAGSKNEANVCHQSDYIAFLNFLEDAFLPSDAPIRPLFLSYSAKNIHPGMQSFHEDRTGFPLAAWFEPDWILAEYRDGELLEWGIPMAELTDYDDKVIDSNTVHYEPFKASLLKQGYFEAFDKIQKHLLRGDIYEMNFCLHFSTFARHFNGLSYFEKLNRVSPAPMATLFKINHAWVISSSPERFLTGNRKRLISQPIKGTSKRGRTSEEDEEFSNDLRNDSKETAENVMIVDLVRNDLSHFAKRGSVNVDELFGIYCFPQVFQMISTVSCELRSSELLVQAILKAFPMGSMTGVPKLSAMRIAEELEGFTRGPYSGSIGYVCTDGSFDLNVVIRSITWNEKNKYLSFSAGSAITIRSEPQKEYEECLLKAKTLYQVLETGSPWLKA